MPMFSSKCMILTVHVTGALHSGRHRGDVAKAVLAAKARVKDPDSARALEADLLEANEYLELNAAMGMAAMLLVGGLCSS